jgi:hypothetical protein
LQCAHNATMEPVPAWPQQLKDALVAMIPPAVPNRRQLKQ